MNILLWIFQILLALTFLFAGGMKLVIPTEVLNSMAPPNAILFPGWFLKFIGLCEVLGALGLILPGIFRRKQYLTIYAAIGLLIIMIGAIVVSIIGGGVMAAASPFIIGVLCLFVAYGRAKVAPLR
ncbi:MAG TPA: DoxX family protein [Pyrinomonadaceae bacterium]|nr:DoxX family protein [Pyrinomonadaceae bacterium]